MKNKNIIILEKIKNYCCSILKYTNEIDYEEFLGNSMLIEACVFNFSQIGELVKIIDKQIIEKYSYIEWIAIRNLRNKMVHDYGGIQLKRIWQFITNDVPKLVDDIEHIIKEEK